LEQKKFVKSITAPGTTKKSYILYEIEADDNLTGGTFYSGQQFDSQFVRDLLGVCVKMLQVKLFQISTQILLFLGHIERCN
jgi:DNA-directed RNA polymerase III subunit RPC6